MITRPNTSATPTTPSASWRSEFVMIAPQPANTSAKAAIASAPARGSGGPSEALQEHADPPLDLVADGPDLLDAPARGVVELPVLIALARIDRAGVAATHGDHDVGLAGRAVGERFRKLPGDVDPHLGHRLDRRGVHLVGGVGPGA